MFFEGKPCETPAFRTRVETLTHLFSQAIQKYMDKLPPVTEEEVIEANFKTAGYHNTSVLISATLTLYMKLCKVCQMNRVTAHQFLDIMWNQFFSEQEEKDQDEEEKKDPPSN